MKKIKKSHVLVVASGNSLKKYWIKIEKFIKENDLVIFGCNNINHILTPDYHFWADKNRYKEFGKYINKNSVPVFSDKFDKKLISKYCERDYLSFRYRNKRNSKIEYKNNTMYGFFRAVGSLAIFYAFINNAKKISIVGMDGYTLYSENKLINKEESQHCYNLGYTDLNKKTMKQKTKKHGYNTFYEFEVEKDKQIYKCLKDMKNYGIKFKIITPTVYSKFYDPNILKID